MNRVRVPVRFSIVGIAEQVHKLPNGQNLTQPKHWRMIDAQGKIMASGPWETEADMTLILRCAGEFMFANPKRARELAAITQHIQVKVPLSLVTDS